MCGYTRAHTHLHVILLFFFTQKIAEYMFYHVTMRLGGPSRVHGELPHSSPQLHNILLYAYDAYLAGFNLETPGLL